MPARPSFIRAATAGEDQEDPYTRSPITLESRRARAARRLSMASTIFTIGPNKGKDAGPAPRTMPAPLNIARCVIYVAVLIWSIVVLAIAIHLNSILQSSALTTFVPFAIFVSIASLLIFPILLGFSFWKRHASPISARIELGCLGLAGTLWIALGAFMATSDAQLADVECYASADDTEVIEVPGFSTETFHAQYRVMEAFSLFNAILIWGFLLFFTILALRQHVRGNTIVWSIPVTALPWASSEASKLPPPVTGRQRSVSRSPKEKDFGLDEKRGRSAAPARRPTFRAEPSYIKETGASPATTPSSTPGSTPRGQDAYIMWMPHMPKDGAGAQPGQSSQSQQMPRQPPAARTVRAPIYDTFQRSASPRRPDAPRRKDTWGRDASPRRR